AAIDQAATSTRSAIFRIPHVLFQQRLTSSIRDRETAGLICCYEAELPELACNARWNRRWRVLGVGRRPDLAQPIKVLRREVRAINKKLKTPKAGRQFPC